MPLNQIGPDVPAGLLRRRVGIQKPVTTTDSEGTESTTWWPVAMCWASVEPLGQRERLEAEQLQNPRRLAVMIRYRAGITAAMRLLHGQSVYEIQAVLDVQERHMILELDCIEIHP